MKTLHRQNVKIRLVDELNTEGIGEIRVEERTVYLSRVLLGVREALRLRDYTQENEDGVNGKEQVFFLTELNKVKITGV